MTTRNSILLIIRQSEGIDYNALLNKVSQSYSSINSARAALSRALKDLLVLDLVRKEGSKFFVSEKGNQLIHSEMKSKLLLRLSELVKSRSSHQEIDSIVQQLHTLLERAKSDSDLLKAARGSAGFYISDLQEINSRIEQRAKHLNYLSSVFQEQINSLKQLDFNDSKRLPSDSSLCQRVSLIAQKLGVQEIVVECQNQEFLQKASQALELKAKENTASVPVQKLSSLFPLIEEFLKQKPLNSLTLYLSPFRLDMSLSGAVLSGPHSKLNEVVL